MNTGWIQLLVCIAIAVSLTARAEFHAGAMEMESQAAPEQRYFENLLEMPLGGSQLASELRNFSGDAKQSKAIESFVELAGLPLGGSDLSARLEKLLGDLPFDEKTAEELLKKLRESEETGDSSSSVAASRAQPKGLIDNSVSVSADKPAYNPPGAGHRKLSEPTVTNETPRPSDTSAKNAEEFFSAVTPSVARVAPVAAAGPNRLLDSVRAEPSPVREASSDLQKFLGEVTAARQPASREVGEVATLSTPREFSAADSLSQAGLTAYYDGYRPAAAKTAEEKIEFKMPFPEVAGAKSIFLPSASLEPMNFSKTCENSEAIDGLNGEDCFASLAKTEDEAGASISPAPAKVLNVKYRVELLADAVLNR